jgi:SAM-dependent methyltransferase
MLLNDSSLESSCVVANSLMNRQRGVVGVNSYERELRFDPVVFLLDRLRAAGHASWLDLCCGSGKALIEAARQFQSHDAGKITLHGLDLVRQFQAIPADVSNLRFEVASLHRWVARGMYDLITCVHGLHYIGDKLSVIERCASWLTDDGQFIANLDLANCRSPDGSLSSRTILQRFRVCGLAYDTRRRLLSCLGAKSVSLGFQYLGADDRAGPNYTGQEAVTSFYSA